MASSVEVWLRHSNSRATDDVIGNVEAYSTISVKSQIGGQLTQASFREGEFVKKNDLLFTIDPRPYEAALSQVQRIARAPASGPPAPRPFRQLTETPRGAAEVAWPG